MQNLTAFLQCTELTESNWIGCVCWTGITAITLGEKTKRKTKKQPHTQPRNHTNKFPDDPSKEFHPSPSATRRSLAGCVSKEACTVLGSVSLLANEPGTGPCTRWNVLNLPNASWLWAAVGAAGFTTVTERVLVLRWESPVCWDTFKFDSLYYYLQELSPKDLVCCAHCSCVLQRTKWPIIVSSRGNLSTMEVKFIQFFAHSEAKESWDTRSIIPEPV